jgi:hypothetical protein
MRIFTLGLFLLLLSGCSTGVIVHDQDRAAELVVDCLTAFKSDNGIKLSYEWTDDKFKEDVSEDEFARIVSTIRDNNQGAEIHLDGFEFFGPVEAITVHARSQNSTGITWFKFMLVGTKTKDYYLLDLKTSTSEFAKEGIYRKYEQSILVQGV